MLKIALLELVQEVTDENRTISSDEHFFSYEASFDRKVNLDECLDYNLCTVLIAGSMDDEKVRKSIHAESRSWILYEKHQTEVLPSTGIAEAKQKKAVLSEMGRKGERENVEKECSSSRSATIYFQK